MEKLASKQKDRSSSYQGKSSRVYSKIPATHIATLRSAVAREGAPKIAQKLEISANTLYKIMQQKGKGVFPSTLAKIGLLVEHTRQSKDELGPADVLSAARAVNEAISGLSVDARIGVLKLVLSLIETEKTV